MAHSVFLSIALWIWVLSAVGAMVLLISAWVSEGIDSGRGMAAMLAFLLAASGLLFCSLELLGWPLVASWSWRILSGGVMITSLVFSARVLVRGNSPEAASSEPGFSAYRRHAALDSFLLYCASVLAIIVFACAIFATTPQPGASAPVSYTAREAVAHNLEDSLLRLDFWHAATLGVLGCGTLLFGLLFIGALQRQGLLWFESNSGGLGGGVGGWRMSSTVGYLAATVLFGAMFGALVVRDEAVVKPPSRSGDAPAASGSKEAPAPVQTPRNDAAGAASPVTANPTPSTGAANSPTAQPNPDAAKTQAPAKAGGQGAPKPPAKGAVNADHNPR
jgi:hypothetical protein